MVTTDIDPGMPAMWPDVSQHDIDLPDFAFSGGEFTVGYWGNWPGMFWIWFVGADLGQAESTLPPSIARLDHACTEARGGAPVRRAARDDDPDRVDLGGSAPALPGVVFPPLHHLSARTLVCYNE